MRHETGSLIRPGGPGAGFPADSGNPGPCRQGLWRPRPAFKALFTLAVLLLQPAPAQVRADWVRRYDNNWRDDRAVDMTVDPVGNCWITGHTASIADDHDIITVKYRADGFREWVRHYGAVGSDDRPAAITSDAAGNVYVAGRTGQDRSSGLIVRYDPDGTERWARQLIPPDSGPSVLELATMDYEGMIIAAGWTGTAPDQDMLTVKLDTTGAIIWIRRYAGPGSGPDLPRAMVSDSGGNTYVTGQTCPRIRRRACPVAAQEDSADILTLKYDRDGNELWGACWAGLGAHRDIGGAVAVDRGVVVVGGVSSIRGDPDSAAAVVVKYDMNGETLWTRTWRETGRGTAEMRAVDIGSDGAIHLAGTSVGVGTGLDFMILKYSVDGTQLWVRCLDRDSGPDEMAAMTGDGSGNIYLTGRSWSSGSDYDFLTMRCNPSGDTAWTVRYDRSWSSDAATALAVDDAGNVYVAGTSWDDYSGDDFAVVKYLQPSGQQEPARGPAGGQAPVQVRGGVLYYGGTEPAAVCDVSGRRLLRVRSGVNDARVLPPGVYVLSSGSARPGHKFVVR